MKAARAAAGSRSDLRTGSFERLDLREEDWGRLEADATV